jgi:hypothetical protein
MCNNYPNCNCSSCSPCQSCTQVTPTCNCTTTCTCTTEQFTEECPCGLQSTNCLIYTGDNLQDCEGDDYLFRGTNFNTFLSQLWETVKCAATPTTNTVEYDGANIRNCDNTATVVATGSSLTVALNNIWNAVKCLYNDIRLRQPVWQGSTNILIGSLQAPPFNTMDSAITELAKYHFDTNFLTLILEDGIYTVTPTQFHLMNVNSYTVRSLSGNRANCILTSSGQTIANGLQYAEFKNLTVKSTGTQGVVVGFSNNSHTSLDNCIIETVSTNTSAVSSYESGYVAIRNCKIVNKSTNPINLVLASDHGVIFSGNLEVDNSLGNSGSNLYLAQVNSDIEVIYNNPVSTTVVDNISTVFTTYLNSRITVASFQELKYNNIGYAFILCQDGSSIIHRALDVSGTFLNTIVDGVSLTSGGAGANIIGCYTNSIVNTSKITGTTFNRAVYVFGNSKLGGDIAISNVVHGLWLDRNCSLQVNGSIDTTGNHGLVMFNNSDVVTDNLQITGQAVGVTKVLMMNASRLSRNSSLTGSNIGNNITFSGSGNIVTG